MNVRLKQADHILFCDIEERVFHIFTIFANPKSVSFKAHPGKPRR